MRPIRFRVLAAMLGVIVLSACSRGRATEGAQSGSAQAFPAPPMQHGDWTPPKGDLPADLIAATKRLFDKGLADPRTCEYRSISVEVGSVWGGGGPVECHGWLLPSKDPKAQRFVICWNGLVYPAASVKDKADLDADIAALIKSDDDARAAAARRNNGIPFHRFGLDFPAEGQAVSEKSMLPIKVCMLLRLGKGDLAERFYKAWGGGSGGPNSNLDIPLTGALIWANFDRAICAHMRGDDQLSLRSAEAAEELSKSLPHDPQAGRQPGADPFSYLEVLPALIQDEKRRLAEPPRKLALKLGQASFASKAAWVTALVADLDQVSATQSGQPGGVALGSDPIVAALIACGDDAVEPLLDCFEHDTRLTRSVHFWRDFSPSRMPIGVPEAAYVALSGVLQTSFFSVGSTGDDLTAHGEQARAKIAQQMRDYWKKYKGVSLPDRWFMTLADDNAGDHKWEEALANILRPVDVTVTPGSMFGTGWVSVPERKPGEKPVFSGESLRAKKNPSLLDLAEKRIKAIDHLDDRSSMHVYQVAAASDMAIGLMKWDPTNAARVARQQLDFCVEMFKSGFFNTYGDPSRAKVAGLAAALARAGDHSGLKIYGDWMRTITPKQLGASPEAILSPLWQFQDDPAIAATAEYLFNDPQSAWNPMLPKVEFGWNQQELLRSPLLGLKSFRDQMIRGLADETPWGTVTIGDDRTVEMKTTMMNQSIQIPSAEPATALGAKEMKSRICDEYAYEISLCAGAPEFQFYWPQVRRDAAIAACREFLSTFEENLRYTDKYVFKGEFAHIHEMARLTFAPLDHPATQDDVKSHRAIFSLEGMGERRQYKLPSIPMKAKWITLKKYPLDQQYFSMDGHSGVNHVFQDECWIWQAEELKTADGWVRYFGVVGPHEVAKVPASEIDFDDYGWTNLPNGLDLRIEDPRLDHPDAKAAPLSTKSPLPIRIVIRNRNGVAQSLPTEFLSKTGDGKLAIRPGMKIVLTPQPDTGSARGGSAGVPAPLAMKPLPLLSAGQIARKQVLQSLETRNVAEFDLHDLFDIPGPGDYELQLSFTKHSEFGEAFGWPVYLQFTKPQRSPIESR